MKVEIDQSGKVEVTSAKTVIADSAGRNLVISAKNKKLIQELYRKADKPRMFVYELFSLLVAILIKQSYLKENIYVVDIEYYRQDDLLRRMILHFLLKLKIVARKDQIIFRAIGKRSKAHDNAYLIFIGKNKTGKKITLKELLKYLLQ